MIGVIKTRFVCLFISLFITSFLSAQSSVDFGIYEILAPDSVIFCSNKDIAVKVAITLNSSLPVDSFQLSYQLDNRTVVSEKVKRRMVSRDSIHYVFVRPLSRDSFVNGRGILKISVATYSGTTDFNAFNNSQSISIRISALQSLPYSVNFDGTTNAPMDWTGIKMNANASGAGGYIEDYVRGINGVYANSLAFRSNIFPPIGPLIVKTPVLDLGNADLPYFYFNYAYGNNSLDTFKIEVTKDCGASYQTLFMKGGSQLWTMFRNSPYDASDWKRDSLPLKAYLGQKVQFKLTCISNISSNSSSTFYIDDVRVANRDVVNKELILLQRITPDNNPICPSDKKQIPVEVVLKNGGKITTDTIQMSFRVNNGIWVTEKVVKALNLDDSLRYTFTQLMTVPDTGAVVLTIAVGQKNEQNLSNDTLKTTLNVRREFAVPFIEKFETDVFPPKDWPTETNYYYIYGVYKEASVIGRNGQPTSAVYFDKSNATPIFITTAPINLKSVRDPYLAFDVSYNANDYGATLAVEISTDCGITFQNIYLKRGDSLRTHSVLNPNGPSAGNQWRRDSISLSPYKNSDAMFRFTTVNSFRGVAIYVDNIDVFNRNTPQKDASISKIKTPVPSVFCPVGTPFLPMQIEVGNTGLSKIDTFIISYKINNTPSVFDTVLRSLAFGETFIHTFKKLPPFPKGGSVSFFYTVNVKGDLDNRNDTISNRVVFPTQYALAFNENFEGVIPNSFTQLAGWQSNYNWIFSQVTNSDGLKGICQKYPISIGSTSIGLLQMPYIDLSNSSSPYLTFDLAFARRDTFTNSQLKVEVSTDCGVTFKPTAYDKTRKALETYSTDQYASEPLLAKDWRRDTVSLTAFKDSLVIIRFVGSTTDGVPFYIDNVRVEGGFKKDVSVLSRIFPDTTPVCYPQRSLPVRIAVRNDGVTAVDTIKLTYRLDTEGVVSQTFIRRINYRDTAIFTFSQLMTVSTVGNHNLTFTINVNGDENKRNDTLKTVFRLRPQYKPNINEGFETPDFPPLDWTLRKSDASLEPWGTARGIGSRGDSTTAAFFTVKYPYQSGAENALTTYPVDLTNIPNPIALFDLSYLGYTGVIGGGTDTSNAFKVYYDDTLRVDISTDCGQTFRPTGYKKTKNALTTVLRTYESQPDYGPRITTYSDWRRDTIDLSAYKGGVVQLRFVHITPGTGITNTLYLDNVQFVNHESKNVSLFNFVTPNESTVLCNNEAFPITVKLINDGRTRVDSFEIKYQIDSQVEVKEQVKLSLNPKESKDYRFVNLLRGVKSGEHSLRVVIRMVGDTISLGDTLFRKITVGTTYSVPLIETFEGDFPPSDWHIEDRNYYFTTNWRRGFGQNIKNENTNTAMYNTNTTGVAAQDALITWQVNLKNMKNPYLVFDIAAFRHYLQNFDTFRIEYSTDCGYTYKPTTYIKSDEQFITSPNPSLNSIVFPKRGEWRNDSVRLFNLRDSLVQFRFSATAKPSFGMVIHLDNIRIIELPLTKTNDVSEAPQYSRVFPNPSTGDLSIELTQTFGQTIDCQLRNVQGQIIKREILTASNLQNWHLGDVPAGMYFLYVGINNQFEKHKIVLIK
jgi:Secretion system C-terminal sorting domain